MTNEDLINELKTCLVDMFEAEEKFYVLSFYISDPQAKQCADDRVRWFRESGDRIQKVLKMYEGQKK